MCYDLVCAIPLAQTMNKLSVVPPSGSQIALMPLHGNGAALGKEDNRKCGEDKSGMLSIWKNQRIHIMSRKRRA